MGSWSDVDFLFRWRLFKAKVEQKVCMSVSLNTYKTNRNAKWMSKVKLQIIYLLDDVENYFIMIGLEQANIVNF